VHQNIRREPSSCPKQPSRGREGDDRIDRLSDRLEQYILLNKEKIESNRRFIRENSVARP
jgi:hypothetical protein